MNCFVIPISKDEINLGKIAKSDKKEFSKVYIELEKMD